ncbi:hypothetical protein [Legionella sainthelensi]|uniref:hypothetical protein n=1 Tax=Legionella sainthelensi TaxID=28087 RepID=UPI000E1FDA8E|nr:hypothetical protein [Legionella sainthelensi]
MIKKKTWLQKIINKPRDRVEVDPYYMKYFMGEDNLIRDEVDNLVGFKTTDEQFNSLLYAWHCRDLLIARCDQYNFKKFRYRIDAFIKQIEADLDEQQSIIDDVNFLFPISGCSEIKDVISLNTPELDRLKKIRNALSQERGSRGNKNYLTKRAYFELFFIGELLGLEGFVKSGEKNDLITLAEIITQQVKPNRAGLSEHYQKYELFKKMTPEVNSLVRNGKRRYCDNPNFSSSLEQFQTDIYSHIPIPSSK